MFRNLKVPLEEAPGRGAPYSVLLRTRPTEAAPRPCTREPRFPGTLVQNHPSNGWHWEHPVLRSPGFIRKHHACCSAAGRRSPLCGVCCQSPLCPAAGCATFLRPQRRGPISGASPPSSCLFGQKSLSILVVSNCCFHLRNAARGLEFGDLSAFSAWSWPGHETGGVHTSSSPRDPSHRWPICARHGAPTDVLHPQTHRLQQAPLETDGSTQRPYPHLPWLG